MSVVAGEGASVAARPGEASAGTWRLVAQSLTTPYRVPASMVLLVSLVPLYVFIPELLSGRTLHVPELAWDRLVPLQPSWVLFYGPLYLFLIVLPVLVVRQEEHIRRTVLAYLSVWITAYVCFLVYPTTAPRPAALIGEGFGVWSLRLLYAADPPYNCLPSLHVAHSFVSALTCHRVHRRLGLAALLAASLVALSTLFTKQHYVLDVVAGALMGCVAYGVFVRPFPREKVPELDRRLAPVLALGILAILGLAVAGAWLVYAGGIDEPLVAADATRYPNRSRFAFSSAIWR